MKLNEFLWMAAAALVAAILSQVDYRYQGGRVLGLCLIVAGWLLLGALVLFGSITLGWGASVAAIVTGSAVLGSLVGAARDRLVCVKVPPTVKE